MGLVKVLRAFQEAETADARKITKNNDSDSVEVNNIITINSINCLYSLIQQIIVEVSQYC